MDSERVMVFIDGSNLYFSLKDANLSTKVDFHKFALQLTGNRHYIRTYYYNAPYTKEIDEEKYRNQQRFFNKLKRVEKLELRLGRIMQRERGQRVEKGVDVALAVTMIEMAFDKSCDTIILVSGDSDFAPAIRVVKRLGRNVEVACFESALSDLLKDVCDSYITLTPELINKCVV